MILRSLPPDNPHIWEEGRFQNRERPVVHWGLGAANYQPRAAPGKYTVRMTLNGKQFTQPFEVWRDVTLPTSDADLVAATAFQRRIIGLMNEVADKINKIEIMRMQVEDLRKAHGANAALDKALAGIHQKMYDTELHFLSRTEMHSDDKWYVEKYKVYFNLIWLLAEVGGGGGDVWAAPAIGRRRRDERVRGSAEGRAAGALGVHDPAAGSRGVQQGQRRQAAADHGQVTGTLRSRFRVPVPGSSFRGSGFRGSRFGF